MPGRHELWLQRVAAVGPRRGASRPFIRRAIELGFNFFDTADMYSAGASEQVLGRALRDFSPGRNRIVVATKVYMPMSSDPNHKGLSRKHIMHQSMTASAVSAPIT